MSPGNSAVCFAVFFVLVLSIDTYSKQEDNKRKYTISSETTFVTQPLNQNGQIDFIAAVNRRFSRGVTNENNAARKILPLIDRQDWRGKHRDRLMADLEIDESKIKASTRIVGYPAYAQDLGIDANTLMEAVHSRNSMPWSRESAPEVAAYLDENSAPLDALVAATRQKRFHAPLDESAGSAVLIEILLDEIQPMRNLARVLACRAMWRLHDDEFALAFEDILAIKRLGRLISTGPTLIHGLVGIAVESIADQAAIATIQHASGSDMFDPKSILDSWPGERDMQWFDLQITFAERLMVIQLLIRGSEDINVFASSMGLAGDSNNATAKFFQVLCSDHEIDWNAALRVANEFFDRHHSILDTNNFRSAKQTVDQIEKQLSEIEKKFADPVAFAEKLDQNPETRGRAAGEYVIAMLFPASSQVVNAWVRTQNNNKTIKIALATLVFKKTKGRYPTRLDELGIVLPVEGLTDSRSGEPFRYEVSDASIIIYHAGPNRRFDGWPPDESSLRDDWGIELSTNR